VADDRRSRLGSKRFEQLQIMKFAWRNTITDLAAWNSGLVEEFDLEEFEDLLVADNYSDEFNIPEDEIVILD
jgi:hypothetical protein